MLPHARIECRLGPAEIAQYRQPSQRPHRPASGRHGILQFLVRSEGGRIYCDINELQGLSNHKVHFEPKSVFQEVPL